MSLSLLFAPLFRIGTWLLGSLLVLAASVDSFGANWPDEVAGVRWGAAPASVQQVMSSRSGITTGGSPAPDKLTFRGGAISGQTVLNWIFEFTSDKLTKITLIFPIRHGPDGKGDFVGQDYNQLLKVLESRYGKSQQGKLRATADPNFDAVHWQFSDTLNPKASKTIELYHGWTPHTHGSSHLEITYNAAATGPQIPLSPVKSGGSGGL